MFNLNKTTGFAAQVELPRAGGTLPYTFCSRRYIFYFIFENYEIWNFLLISLLNLVYSHKFL